MTSKPKEKGILRKPVNQDKVSLERRILGLEKRLSMLS